MKKTSILLVFPIFLSGCLGLDCSPGNLLEKQNSKIDLKLISKVDSINLTYLNWENDLKTIKQREEINTNFNDTVELKFYGLEEYYRDEFKSYVQVDSVNVLVRHLERESIEVVYSRPINPIEVLKKVACSPVEPSFKVDSIILSHSEKIKVSMTIK